MALALQRSRWHTQATGTLAVNRMGYTRLQLIGHSFAEKMIKALKGEKGIVEPTFIYLPGVPGGEAIAKETGVDYFSVPVELGVSPPNLRTCCATC